MLERGEEKARQVESPWDFSPTLFRRSVIAA